MRNQLSQRTSYLTHVLGRNSCIPINFDVHVIPHLADIKDHAQFCADLLRSLEFSTDQIGVLGAPYESLMARTTWKTLTRCYVSHVIGDFCNSVTAYFNFRMESRSQTRDVFGENPHLLDAV